jgi:hypothetical protein
MRRFIATGCLMIARARPAAKFASKITGVTLLTNFIVSKPQKSRLQNDYGVPL